MSHRRTWALVPLAPGRAARWRSYTCHRPENDACARAAAATRAIPHRTSGGGRGRKGAEVRPEAATRPDEQMNSRCIAVFEAASPPCMYGVKEDIGSAYVDEGSALARDACWGRRSCMAARGLRPLEGRTCGRSHSHVMTVASWVQIARIALGCSSSRGSGDGGYRGGRSAVGWMDSGLMRDMTSDHGRIHRSAARNPIKYVLCYVE